MYRFPKLEGIAAGITAPGLLVGTLFAVSVMSPSTLYAAPVAYSAAANPAAGPAFGADDTDASSAVTAKLNKKQFQNVKVTVQDGIASLTGSVDLYEYKSDADKQVHKVKGIVGVRNDIQVAGPEVSDAQLQDKLVEKLQYDRVGYGNTFNAITVNVQGGAVTLGGHARGYVDKDSALALVGTYPGVKDVNDEIQVDPVSIMDDQIRMAVARSVYSFPSLNRYALDPAKPIRISVQNGDVELYGMVDNEADKDAAFIRAKTVPGVFDVKNYILVANQPGEKTKN